MKRRLDTFFGVSAAGSSWTVEVRAGLTTFLTMSYILFVNPTILGAAIPLQNGFPQLLTATALAAAFGSLAMGLIGRLPYALAPGMGLNAYFAYTVVLGQNVPWQTALGAVFLSGTLFFIISLVGLRTALIDAIPPSLKAAITAGIGLFLAAIGMQNAGWVVDHPVTLVQLGSLHNPATLIALFVLLLIVVLSMWRIHGAILYGILGGTAVAILTQAPVYQGRAFAGFDDGFIRAPVLPTELALAMDPMAALEMGVLSIVFTFLFVDFFDTAGTLIGLERKTKKKINPQPDTSSAAFGADAMATMVGAAVGTSSTTCYIESAAGIEEGARTGFTAVVVALLFLVSTCFWPVAAAIPPVATAPVLVVIGASMLFAVKDIPWHQPADAVPAVLVILGMPLTYSITDGLSLGVISYTLFQLVAGQLRRSQWLLILIAALLALRYAFLAT